MYKRQCITIQFIQQGILLLHNNEIKEYKLKSVDNYKVIDKKNILEEIQSILNNLNINKNILTCNINIIVDSTYTKLDKDNIESIFKELSFNKIKFINLIELLSLTQDELLIDISLNNIKIYYLNEVIEQKIYFSKYIQSLNILLKSILKKHNIKAIKLFGNNCNKKIIKQIEELSKINVYIYSQPNLIPIQLFT